MFKNLFFILLFLFVSYNFSYATELSLNIEWWDIRNVYYNESLTLNAIATFPEWCTSTWITWLKSNSVFPFNPIILWTWISYTQTYTNTESISININCDSMVIGGFVFVTIKSPEVAVWANTSYNSWDTVNLSWSIIWADSNCTSFDYNWEQISWNSVEISNSWISLHNSNSYTGASFIFPDTTENIVLRLNITPQSCYHAGNTYSGTVTYSKNTPAIAVSSWWWGGSWNYRMREEAENIFYDTWSIDKIELKLQNPIIINFPYMNFNWNNIWWDWQINYILEYSTWSNFESWSVIQYKTTERWYNFIEYSLNENSFIHYFRLKAEYNWKETKYSNIIKYYSEDYLPLICKKDKKFVNFEDIFLGEDFLIDDFFEVKCKKCKK